MLTGSINGCIINRIQYSYDKKKKKNINILFLLVQELNNCIMAASFLILGKSNSKPHQSRKFWLHAASMIKYISNLQNMAPDF